MRFIRTKAVIATVGLALSLAACGDAGDDGGETTDVEVQENAGDEFDDGTAMKEFADSGEITIGVKYDQPGIGFKGATDDMPVGFDPEIGKILAGSLGIAPGGHHLEGDHLRQPRALPPGGRGRPRHRVVLHHRRAPRRSSARPAPTT